MQRTLLGIMSVDLNATGQLLIIYSAFIKYLRKMGIQWSSASAINRFQESLWLSWEGGLIEYGVPMKLVGLIKMCLHKTYSRIRARKHLSVMFPIINGFKQGDVLSLLFCNLAVTVGHQEGSCIPGLLEIKWYTSASSLYLKC